MDSTCWHAACIFTEWFDDRIRHRSITAAVILHRHTEATRATYSNHDDRYSADDCIRCSAFAFHPVSWKHVTGVTPAGRYFQQSAARDSRSYSSESNN